MSRLLSAALLCGAVLLGACSEQAQGPSARKSDVPAWQGGAEKAYAAGGWSAGDRSSWESQLRNRALNQNEYVRGQPQ